MNRKIPVDAFQAYFALGPTRSYRELAKKYGVSKRAITRLAASEKWTERLQRLEREARERTDKRVGETIDEMTERHMRIAKFVQSRALEALKRLPLEKASDAVKALDLAVRAEAKARVDPSDRQATIEELVRDEARDLLLVVEDETLGPEDDGRGA